MPLNQIASSFPQPGAQPFAYASGNRYPPTIGQFNIANNAMTADRLVATPFFCRTAKSFTGASVYQHNAGVTGNIRLGVYAMTGGRPVALEQDIGAVAFPGSTGWRTVSAMVTLAAGWHWLAAVADAALGVATIEASAPPLPQSLLGMEFGFDVAAALTQTAFQNYMGFVGTHVYAALPNPFPTITNYSGAVTQPCICLVG
jgi:hypothetical protein